MLGYGVLIAAAVVRGAEQTHTIGPLDRALQACGQLLHDAGVTMIVIFVVSTFRPRELWAKALAALLIGALWGGTLGWELSNRFDSIGRGNGFWWLEYAAIWTYPLWTMVESYRYYALMRRRQAIGLADPMVTNRFLLWGSASLGTALATWTSSIGFFLPQRPERRRRVGARDPDRHGDLRRRHGRALLPDLLPAELVSAADRRRPRGLTLRVGARGVAAVRARPHGSRRSPAARYAGKGARLGVRYALPSR